MIWPFKKRKALTIAEYAELQPMPACCDPETHYYWKLQGYSCPTCSANAKLSKAESDQNRLAEKIATAVVRKLTEKHTEPS